MCLFNGFLANKIESDPSFEVENMILRIQVEAAQQSILVMEKELEKEKQSNMEFFKRHSDAVNEMEQNALRSIEIAQ